MLARPSRCAGWNGHVWHAKKPTFGLERYLELPEICYVSWPDDYEHVATVIAPGLEQVFEMTQDAWSENDNVFCLVDDYRSISVGDVVSTPKGEIRRYEPDGWSLIDWVS
jgi:hypothetical protein